jgi:glycolate oxidase
MESLMSEMEAISALLEDFDCGEIFFADDAQQKAELWKLRRRVAEAVKLDGIYNRRGYRGAKSRTCLH